MLSTWGKYRHSFWSAILLLIRTIAGLGAQKAVAILYGPAGTTLFSHFQNLLALFTQPIQDAVGNGLVNAFPKRSFQKTQIMGTAIIILVLLVTSTGLFLLISNQFRQSFFSFSLQDWLLMIPSIILFCFGLVVSAIYVIQQKLKLYSIIISIQWLIFFIVVGFNEFKLHQFLIFWLLIQSLFSLILIYPVYSYLKFNFKIGKEVKHHFRQFLIMAITVWLSSKWVDYFIRELAIQEFGAIQTGLWQSIVRISEAYRGLLISFLFLSLYPMISRKIASKSLDISIVRSYYFPYCLFSILFLFFVFQFDELILKMLYDDQYVKAVNLFRFQLIGDLFAFLAFPFSVYLIASVQTKTYIFTEILSAVIFVSFIILKSFIGIEILVYAHIIRFSCYLLTVAFVGIKSLRNAG
jgi:PST family polysaccharide transporter